MDSYCAFVNEDGQGKIGGTLKERVSTNLYLSILCNVFLEMNLDLPLDNAN